jgi:hypothetical protein
MSAGPVDVRDPASVVAVEMNDPSDPELVRSSLVVGVIHVEDQLQTLLKFDAEALQVLSRPGACQPEAIGIVEGVEIR